VEITSSSYTAALQSKDRDYRRAAFEALMGSFLDVKAHWRHPGRGHAARLFYSKARKYPPVSLPLWMPKICQRRYDNLVKTVPTIANACTAMLP